MFNPGPRLHPANVITKIRSDSLAVSLRGLGNNIGTGLVSL